MPPSPPLLSLIHSGAPSPPPFALVQSLIFSSPSSSTMEHPLEATLTMLFQVIFLCLNCNFTFIFKDFDLTNTIPLFPCIISHFSIVFRDFGFTTIVFSSIESKIVNHDIFFIACFSIKALVTFHALEFQGLIWGKNLELEFSEVVNVEFCNVVFQISIQLWM